MPQEGLGCGVSFSPDSHTLFLQSYRTVLNEQKYVVDLYEMTTGKKRATVEYKLNYNSRTICTIFSEGLLTINQNDRIQLFDLLTRNPLGEFKTGRAWIDCLTFAPDGKRLATGNSDTTALVWDISHLVPAPGQIKLGRDELAKLWTNLLDDDAESAFRAIRRLSQSPKETVAFLKMHLQPVPAVPAARIKLAYGSTGQQKFHPAHPGHRSVTQPGRTSRGRPQGNPQEATRAGSQTPRRSDSPEIAGKTHDGAVDFIR